MGPLRDVLGKLPGVGELADQVDERELVKTQAMIQSMTPGERQRPEQIDKSRACAHRARERPDARARCRSWSRASGRCAR